VRTSTFLVCIVWTRDIHRDVRCVSVSGSVVRCPLQLTSSCPLYATSPGQKTFSRRLTTSRTVTGSGQCRGVATQRPESPRREAWPPGWGRLARRTTHAAAGDSTLGYATPATPAWLCLCLCLRSVFNNSTLFRCSFVRYLCIATWLFVRF